MLAAVALTLYQAWAVLLTAVGAVVSPMVAEMYSIPAAPGKMTNGAIGELASYFSASTIGPPTAPLEDEEELELDDELLELDEELLELDEELDELLELLELEELLELDELLLDDDELLEELSPPDDELELLDELDGAPDELVEELPPHADKSRITGIISNGIFANLVTFEGNMAFTTSKCRVILYDFVKRFSHQIQPRTLNPTTGPVNKRLREVGLFSQCPTS
jgi:hypothetical protein